MIFNLKEKLFSILIFSFFIFPIFSFAQNVNSDQIRESDVSVDIVPSIPGPNENVTITLNSLNIDLNKTDITWSINGKFAFVGKGKKTYSITTGGVGTTTIIDVAIVITRNSRIDKKIVIQPSDVDLIWEVPDAYVPPFYKGKALPSSESTLKITAMPNIRTSGGNKVNPSNLIYKWKKNNINLPLQSGYGQNSITVTTSYFNTKEEVSVETSSATENYGAKNKIQIKTVKPKIIFYEDNPLTGINLSTALTKGYTLNTGETSIIGMPYFFTPNDPLDKDLRYTWSINNAKIALPPKVNELVVKSGASEGVAKITLKVENLKKLFQDTTETLFITLGKK